MVHDYLNQYGGGERILETLCELFPRAPIFTLLYDERATGRVFKNREIHTSFLQNLPLVKKHHRIFPMLMPLAIEQFDLSYFDIVISSSASFAKGIITKPKTKHISYCMTPTRFLWGGSHKYVEEFNYSWPVKKLIPLAMGYLRVWDAEAASRPDKFIAISDFIKERIKKYYGRDSSVVYPPVDVGKFHISKEPGKYFLMVGRLVPYKKFDLAVEVFNQLGYPLKIIGDGPERKKLQKIAKKNIEFLGLISDYKLPAFYGSAKAVIFPQEEDFGIVPIEAMASGKPVIAYKGGGALETIVEGETGIFFNVQTPELLSDAVNKFEGISFDPAKIRSHSLKFDKKVFKEKIMSEIKLL